MTNGKTFPNEAWDTNISTLIDGGEPRTKHIGAVPLIGEFQCCQITLRDRDSAYILKTLLKSGGLQDE